MSDLEAQLAEKPKERVVKEVVEVIKEVEVIREVEVTKEVEVIKEMDAAKKKK